jgi:CRISPR-associated exonuclease Cas4
MFSEDDLLPISALQHLLFCERQCALIHIEQQWAENRLTVEGQHLHRKAHQETGNRERDLRIARGLSLRSLTLGLVGKADVVEFRPLDDIARKRLAGRGAWGDRLASGAWAVVPVEYKRGKPKKDDSDRVQLCAQAICLEEMLGRQIPAGALFYGTRRRRTDVIFDGRLRQRTIATAERLHELIASGGTPLARREPKCDQCSLLPLCLPDVAERAAGVAARIERAFQHHLTSSGPMTDLASDTATDTVATP